METLMFIYTVFLLWVLFTYNIFLYCVIIFKGGANNNNFLFHSPPRFTSTIFTDFFSITKSQISPPLPRLSPLPIPRVQEIYSPPSFTLTTFTAFFSVSYWSCSIILFACKNLYHFVNNCGGGGVG